MLGHFWKGLGTVTHAPVRYVISCGNHEFLLHLLLNKLPSAPIFLVLHARVLHYSPIDHKTFIRHLLTFSLLILAIYNSQSRYSKSKLLRVVIVDIRTWTYRRAGKSVCKLYLYVFKGRIQGDDLLC